MTFQETPGRGSELASFHMRIFMRFLHGEVLLLKQGRELSPSHFDQFGFTVVPFRFVSSRLVSFRFVSYRLCLRPCAAWL